MTKLWTLQGNKFDLTYGKVDHSKSHFIKRNKKIETACRKLWPVIAQPDGQIIWCYTDDCHIPHVNDKCLWELEVPDEKILLCIDDIAWNKIIGAPELQLPPCCKPDVGHQPLTGDSWDHLTAPAGQKGYFWSALLRHPIPDYCVKSVKDWG